MKKLTISFPVVLLAAFIGCGALVDQTVFTKADLKDIGMKYLFFVDDFQRSPSNEQELLEYKNNYGNSPRADEAIESGKYVIVWDADILGDKENLGKKLLAYEKEAPTKGGVVCFQGLIVETISKEKFAKAMKATQAKKHEDESPQ